MLARQLARLVPHVVGIDQDSTSIELARRQDPSGTVDFIRGDFLAYPLAPASFRRITVIAALHHVDTRAALGRMNHLLVPGGTLAIVGLARSQLAAAVAGGPATPVRHGGWQVRRPSGPM